MPKIDHRSIITHTLGVLLTHVVVAVATVSSSSCTCTFAGDSSTTIRRRLHCRADDGQRWTGEAGQVAGVILSDVLDVGVGEADANVLGDVWARRRREVELARRGQAVAVEAKERGVVGERRLQGLLEPADPQPGASAGDADLRRPLAPEPPLPHAPPPQPQVMVRGGRPERAAAAPGLPPLPRRPDGPAADRWPRHSVPCLLQAASDRRGRDGVGTYKRGEAGERGFKGAAGLAARAC